MQELRSTPIKVQAGVVEGDYARRSSYYWSEILPGIQVEDTPRRSEPLLRCDDLGIKNQDYYFQLAQTKGVADVDTVEKALRWTTPQVWLRAGILEDLARLDAALEPFGLRLFVLSGYRHPKLQRLVLRQAALEVGGSVAASLLANPDFYTPHSTGAALDVEIWDNGTQSLLPTKLPGHWERHYLESRATLNSDEHVIRDNRRLIHNLLATDLVLAGGHEFIPHPFEYWHYGRNERLSALFSALDGTPHQVFYEELHELPTSTPSETVGKSAES